MVGRRNQRQSLRRKRNLSSEQINHEDAYQREHNEAAERAKQRGHGRQNEHVHADVMSEHRVRDSEWRAVNQLKEFHPASGGADGEQERDDHRQRNGNLSKGRRDVHRRQFGAHAPEHRNLRRAASRKADVQGKEDPGYQARAEEQSELRDELSGENGLIAELPEPEPIGDKTDEDGNHGDNDEEEPNDDQYFCSAGNRHFSAGSERLASRLK